MEKLYASTNQTILALMNLAGIIPILRYGCMVLLLNVSNGQFLFRKANKAEYIKLYRDTQPGQNVYWNGFGNPPSITFHADFNDIVFNCAARQCASLSMAGFPAVISGGSLRKIWNYNVCLIRTFYRRMSVFHIMPSAPSAAGYLQTV